MSQPMPDAPTVTAIQKATPGLLAGFDPWMCGDARSFMIERESSGGRLDRSARVVPRGLQSSRSQGRDDVDQPGCEGLLAQGLTIGRDELPPV